MKVIVKVGSRWIVSEGYALSQGDTISIQEGPAKGLHSGRGKKWKRLLKSKAVHTHYKAEIYCPKCATRHIDSGSWAKRLHHKHLCESCDHVWKLDEFVFGI